MTSDGVPEQTKLSVNYFIVVKVTVHVYLD